MIDCQMICDHSEGCNNDACDHCCGHIRQYDCNTLMCYYVKERVKCVPTFEKDIKRILDI
jgi:hypothetical protein